MRLSPSKRLNELAHILPAIQSIADIGTDHGYLPLILLQNGLIENAILCDVNEGPLNNAKKTLGNTAFLSRVSFRLGSGIEPLACNEVDAVCIAGMGGDLIKSILSQDIPKSKSYPWLLLQPQTEQSELRQWLLSEGFHICFDYYLSDAGKYYEAMLVSTQALRPLYETHLINEDLEFGYALLASNTRPYYDFLNHKLSKYEKIRLALQNAHAESHKLNTVNQKIASIQALIERGLT